MKKEIFIVDDDREWRNNFEQRFNKMGFFDKVIPLKSYNEFVAEFKNSKNFPVGFFDINLKPLKSDNKDGLKCAEHMRNISPDSYIITYSAYEMLESEIKQAGANEFFEKDAWEEDEIFEKVGKLYFEHFNHLTHGLSNYKIKGEIRAIIESVLLEKDIVNLECEYKDIIFTKQYPIRKLIHIGKENLIIDTSISILILENNSGGTSILIKKSNIDYTQIFEDDIEFPEIPDYSSSTLLDSPIFTNKNKKRE